MTESKRGGERLAPNFNEPLSCHEASGKSRSVQMVILESEPPSWVESYEELRIRPTIKTFEQILEMR